jgi:glycosyltransferase involved in cell wall biosynthesis
VSGEPGRADVLVVGVDSTGGWSAAARELVAALRRSGTDARAAQAGRPPRVRTFALTDFVEAWMARQAAQAGIAAHDPRTIIYCSVTASLLWPRPGAITLDSTAAENRPGRHGIWQRAVERRRLAQAPLLLVWSERSLEALRTPHAASVLVPPPIELPDPDAVPALGARDIAVIAYAGDPAKRRLDLVLEAWERVRRPEERLVVTGLPGFAAPPGVESAGRVSGAEFRALLDRARAFVAAPLREDHGIAALEALAHGCQLVTTPSPGPYPARDIAAAVDPRLVGEDLGAALRVALDAPRPDYAAAARPHLARYGRDQLDQTLRESVLPRLLPAWGAPPHP